MRPARAAPRPPSQLATAPLAYLQPSESCFPRAGGSPFSCSSSELTTATGPEAGKAEAAEKSAASSSSR